MNKEKLICLKCNAEFKGILHHFFTRGCLVFFKFGKRVEDI